MSGVPKCGLLGPAATRSSEDQTDDGDERQAHAVHLPEVATANGTARMRRGIAKRGGILASLADRQKRKSADPPRASRPRTMQGSSSSQRTTSTSPPIVAGRDAIGRGFHFVHGVAHGDAQASLADHRHIVDVVADGADFFGARMPHSVGQLPDRRPFADARRRDLAHKPAIARAAQHVDRQCSPSCSSSSSAQSRASAARCPWRNRQRCPAAAAVTVRAKPLACRDSCSRTRPVPAPGRRAAASSSRNPRRTYRHRARLVAGRSTIARPGTSTARRTRPEQRAMVDRILDQRTAGGDQRHVQSPAARPGAASGCTRRPVASTTSNPGLLGPQHGLPRRLGQLVLAVDQRAVDVQGQQADSAT